MPLNRDAYSRYRLLDARLRKKPYPTFDDLMAYVSEHLDKPVGKRTLQMDLQEMRYNQALGFNAPIVYDRAQKIFRYDDPEYSISKLPVTAEELHGLDFAISILDQFKHLPAISEFEDAIIKIADTVKLNKEVRGEADYIQLEKPFLVKGVEYVEPMIRAIRERRVVKFTYRKFGSDKISSNLLQPYLIREHKNFWYVIGNSITKKDHKVLTFALDRIMDLQITEETFSDEKIDKKNFYRHVLGVTIDESKPEKVVLSFSPFQAGYIKAQPIHHSQVVLKESKSELRVSLYLVVNPELKMQLLSYGAHVRVLEPAHLAEYIRATAKDVVALYGKK